LSESGKVEKNTEERKFTSDSNLVYCIKWFSDHYFELACSWTLVQITDWLLCTGDTKKDATSFECTQVLFTKWLLLWFRIRNKCTWRWYTELESAGFTFSISWTNTGVAVPLV